MPKDGFLANAVVPVGAGADALEGSEDNDDEDGDSSGGEEEEAEGANTLQGGGGSGGDGSARRAAAVEGGTSARAASASLGGLSLGGRTAASPGEEGESSSPPEDMDALLEITLLQVRGAGEGGEGWEVKSSHCCRRGMIAPPPMRCTAASGSRLV